MVCTHYSYKSNVIAVDFDGTMAFNSWPLSDSTKINMVLLHWLQKRKEMGDIIILWSCRENYGGKWYEDHPYLNDALQFCHRNGFFFDNVNKNEDEADDERHLYGRKISADFYIDDRAIPFNMNGWFKGLKWRLYLFLVSRFLK